MAERGVVAAGHPLSAAAGAELLRAGGNAVDAAVAAAFASFVAEPMLTALGSGGYLLAAPPDGDPVVLDFAATAPGLGGTGAAAPMLPVEVCFDDATQVFRVGPSSVAAYGAPAGLAAAAARFGTAPLASLTAPAARMARDGVVVNDLQGYVFGILGAIVGSAPEVRARYDVDGRLPRPGDVLRDPELADALDRLGADGPAPFYTGDVAAAVVEHVRTRGGALTAADLTAYRVVERAPVRVAYRGRDVHTNPPPSAGGALLAAALGDLDAAPGPPDAAALVRALEVATGGLVPSRLGSTTHISVLDADGWGCSITCSNGEGSGVSVPGTGLHLNNWMGEEDLAPAGTAHAPGERLPSMMAPTVVRRDGVAELVVGSAGSNRIRSALLQVVVNVVDRGLAAQAAVDAPRVHVEDGAVYAEPGIDVSAFAGRPVTRFRAPHLYFGGCQAVERSTRTGLLSGGGDRRRGGAVARA